MLNENEAVERIVADFWFDPICPWAWMTSRWLLEVEQVRPVTARWHVMSLAALNAGRDMPRATRTDGPGLGPGPRRIAAQEQHGDEVVLPLYSAIGRRLHDEGRGKAAREVGGYDEILAEALLEVGLPEGLRKAASTDEYDAALLASHHAGMDPVGTDVGTPVIHVPGPDGERLAFFGPVVTPIPRGDAAGRLWDGTLLVAGTPGFYELKRSRTQGPIFD